MHAQAYFGIGRGLGLASQPLVVREWRHLTRNSGRNG